MPEQPISNSDMADLGLHAEEGWTGVFTRSQAEGAWPNGTRVMKLLIEAGDMHSEGDTGTVLGSLTEVKGFGYGYFVEWDDMPRKAILTCDKRLRRLD